MKVKVKGLSLLLARGRDRLETFSVEKKHYHSSALFSYSLGDAIDWKPGSMVAGQLQPIYLLLARGRDRLETPH